MPGEIGTQNINKHGYDFLTTIIISSFDTICVSIYHKRVRTFCVVQTCVHICLLPSRFHLEKDLLFTDYS